MLINDFCIYVRRDETFKKGAGLVLNISKNIKAEIKSGIGDIINIP